MLSNINYNYNTARKQFDLIGFPFYFDPILITTICYYFNKKYFLHGTLSRVKSEL